MLNKTKIALAAALLLGTASAVLAADSDENNQRGFVVPGSTDGVNPAYHRDDLPLVQSPRQPNSPENRIQTEGRAPPEGRSLLKEDKEDKEGEKGK